MSPFAIALVHHPVLDRQGAIITTAITNLDLHDLARSACTYGVRTLFIVHPVLAQRELAQRVKMHWVGGSGARRIPTREPAMALIEVVPSLDDVYAALGGRSSVDVYATSARRDDRKTTSYAEGRSRLAAERTALILFGTGFSLIPNSDNNPANGVAENVQATIGGVNAQVVFAGVAPGFLGLTQLNVLIPDTAPANPATQVVIKARDRLNNLKQANPVNISLQ